MSENPAQYRTNGPTHPLIRIAKFLNTFLGPETLEDIPCPPNLQKDYDDMNSQEKQKLFEVTFHTVFKDSAFHVVGILGRELRPVELNLIKHRIVEFLKNYGFEIGPH